MEAITPLRAYSGNGLVWKRVVQVKYFDVVAGGEKVAEVLTVPTNLKELAVGFLYANGYVEDLGGIEKVSVEDDRIVVDLSPDYEFKMGYITSKGVKPLETIEIKPVITGWKISRDKIYEKASRVYHNPTDLPFALISDSNGYLFISEDVVADNAFYKVVGRAGMDHFDLRESFLLISEHLTPEKVVMAAYLGIPIIGTTKLPTDLAVAVGENLGVTVFSLGIDGISVYTHPARIQ